MHTYVHIVVVCPYALIYSNIRADSKVLVIWLNHYQFVNEKLTISTLCFLVGCVLIVQLTSYFISQEVNRSLVVIEYIDIKRPLIS
jgi:hypothetical protein